MIKKETKRDSLDFKRTGMLKAIFIKLLFISVLLSSYVSENNGHTIEMILETPSKYASDRFYPLSSFMVKQTMSFMNYSVSSIDDNTGQMILLSSKPYKVNQNVKRLKVQYVRLYSDSETTIELLVDEESSKIIDRYGPILLNIIQKSFQ